MKRRCYAFGLILLAACDSGGAEPATTVTTYTTIAVAPPTTLPATPAPTTTAPPTTAAPTTVPPTTVAPTPAEIAQTEIRATLETFYADLDRCYAAPNDCDIESLANGFFAPSDDRASTIYKRIWQALQTNGTVKVTAGRIQRTVAWVTTDADGQTGSSLMCEIDDSVDVPEGTAALTNSTEPGAANTTYFRYYFEWQRQPDNSWRVTHSESAGGTTPATDETGELSSLSESELAQCF